MRSSPLVLAALSAASLPALLGCGTKDNPGGASTATATASAPPPTASASAPASASAASPAAARAYLAFQGKLGSSGEVRLVLEKTGARLEGVYLRSGEEAALAGEMKDATRFVLREVVPRGKKGAIVEGTIEGEKLAGTWKDPDAKRAQPFTAGPLRPFGAADASFEESYLGSLGPRIRIRMKLAKAGGKLSGRYRYMKSKDDLLVEGTVSEEHGSLRLTETTSAGKVTGRFEGVLLDKGLAFGRWSSPDGAKTYPFTLRRGDVYPETITLPGGAKIVPQEEHREKGSYCTLSLLRPEVTGAAGAKALNAALNDAAGGGKLDCGEASDEFRHESDTTYHVEAMKKDRFSLSLSFYEYFGGVHGVHTMSCFVADVEKGTLTQTTAKLLSPEARKKATALVNAALRKEHNVEKLTEAGFHEDEVALDDGTVLCVEGTSLVVQYQPYDVAPYAFGAPRAEIPQKDAAPLVAGTALQPFFE